MGSGNRWGRRGGGCRSAPVAVSSAYSRIPEDEAETDRATGCYSASPTWQAQWARPCGGNVPRQGAEATQGARRRSEDPPRSFNTWTHIEVW